MPTLYPQLADREWLLEALSRTNQIGIAFELGCAPSTVSKAVGRYGLQRQGRTSPIPQLRNRAWLVREYSELQKSTVKIAADLECTHSSVRRALVKHNIPTRPRSAQVWGETEWGTAPGAPNQLSLQYIERLVLWWTQKDALNSGITTTGRQRRLFVYLAKKYLPSTPNRVLMEKCGWKRQDNVKAARLQIDAWLIRSPMNLASIRPLEDQLQRVQSMSMTRDHR